MYKSIQKSNKNLFNNLKKIP